MKWVLGVLCTKNWNKCVHLIIFMVDNKKCHKYQYFDGGKKYKLTADHICLGEHTNDMKSSTIAWRQTPSFLSNTIVPHRDREGGGGDVRLEQLQGVFLCSRRKYDVKMEIKHQQESWHKSTLTSKLLLKWLHSWSQSLTGGNCCRWYTYCISLHEHPLALKECTDWTCGKARRCR